MVTALVEASKEKQGPNDVEVIVHGRRPRQVEKCLGIVETALRRGCKIPVCPGSQRPPAILVDVPAGRLVARRGRNVGGRALALET